MSKKCVSRLEKAYHKVCYLCGKPIGFSAYDFSRTKALRYGKKTVPSEELYFHTECYRHFHKKGIMS